MKATVGYAIENFLSEYMTNISALSNPYVVIDFEKISDPELRESILDNPKETLLEFESRVSEFLSNEFGESKHKEILLSNLPQTANKRLETIRTEDLDKLYAFDGIIKKQGKVLPRVFKIDFECMGCGNVITFRQRGKKQAKPRKCSCGGTSFKPIREENVDIQIIEIEELPDKLKEGASTQRRNVLLQGFLTKPTLEKKTRPGQKVRVLGWVIKTPKFLRKEENKNILDFCIYSNNIELLEEDYEELVITRTDERLITTLSEKSPEDLLKIFSSCIAPTIYGNQNIKEAVVLQFFGGVTDEYDDGTSKRGLIHILIIGEAGLGKTQILSSARGINPKARLAIGGQTSGVGLTAAVTKDELTGQYALEAGAMVLANNGLLCLDEIDKMNKEDSASLHEGMESMKITKTKAGINATLPARTSILAAGNPKYGRFDDNAPIVQQIKLPLPLINRFDVIFALKDKLIEGNDENVAKAILNRSRKSSVLTSEISKETLTKYIAYAKKNSSPELSDESFKKLEEYYTGLRKKVKREDIETKSIPITPRQLDGLCRLSEAHARMRLSKTVDIVDVNKAIDIMEGYIKDLGIDPETGEPNVDIATGTKTTARTEVFMDVMANLNADKEAVTENTILKMLQQRGISRTVGEKLLSKAEDAGKIFRAGKTSDGKWKLCG